MNSKSCLYLAIILLFGPSLEGANSPIILEWENSKAVPMPLKVEDTALNAPSPKNTALLEAYNNKPLPFDELTIDQAKNIVKAVLPEILIGENLKQQEEQAKEDKNIEKAKNAIDSAAKKKKAAIDAKAIAEKSAADAKALPEISPDEKKAAIDAKAEAEKAAIEAIALEQVDQQAAKDAVALTEIPPEGKKAAIAAKAKAEKAAKDAAALADKDPVALAKRTAKEAEDAEALAVEADKEAKALTDKAKIAYRNSSDPEGQITAAAKPAKDAEDNYRDSKKMYIVHILWGGTAALHSKWFVINNSKNKSSYIRTDKEWLERFKLDGEQNVTLISLFIPTDEKGIPKLLMESEKDSYRPELAYTISFSNIKTTFTTDLGLIVNTFSPGLGDIIAKISSDKRLFSVNIKGYDRKQYYYANYYEFDARQGLLACEVDITVINKKEEPKPISAATPTIGTTVQPESMKSKEGNAPVTKATGESKSDKKDTQPETAKSKEANSSIAGITLINEVPTSWGLSVAFPVTSYKTVSYSSDSGGILTPQSAKRQEIYGTIDLYYPKVAPDWRMRRWIPHVFVGLPLAGKPFQRPLIGVSIGLKYAEVFGGAVWNRDYESSPGHKEPRWQGIVGLKIPISTAINFISDAAK